MSYTFTFSAGDSFLSTINYPSTILDGNMTFNTITNFDNKNNKFFIGEYGLELAEETMNLWDYRHWTYSIYHLIIDREGELTRNKYSDVELLEDKQQKTVIKSLKIRYGNPNNNHNKSKFIQKKEKASKQG